MEKALCTHEDPHTVDGATHNNALAHFRTSQNNRQGSAFVVGIVVGSEGAGRLMDPVALPLFLCCFVFVFLLFLSLWFSLLLDFLSLTNQRSGFSLEIMWELK